GQAHVGVLLRRTADNGAGVDGILAVRNALDVEDRVEVFERIEAGVVAEWALGSKLVELDIALKNDFGSGRHFEVDSLALDEFDGFAAQETGDHELFNFGRRRDDAGEHECWISPDSYGDFHTAGDGFAGGDARTAAGASHHVDGSSTGVGFSLGGFGTHALAVMLGADLMSLPVHAGGVAVVDLHPVGANVALASVGIAGDDFRKSDERAAIQGPAFQDWKVGEVNVSSLLNDFLAGTGGDDLREKAAHFGEHGEHLDLVEKTLWGLHVHEALDTVGDGI